MQNSRIIGRTMARELTVEEVELVSGGTDGVGTHWTNPGTSTDTGTMCDTDSGTDIGDETASIGG